MYAFLLDHEQGRAIRVKIPKNIENRSTVILGWLADRYDIENTVDFMLTDFDGIITEDFYDDEVAENPIWNMMEQVAEDLKDTDESTESLLRPTPIPEEVVYKGQKIMMSGPPKDSEPLDDGNGNTTVMTMEQAEGEEKIRAHIQQEKDDR